MRPLRPSGESLVKLLTRPLSAVIKRLSPQTAAKLKHRKRQRRKAAFFNGDWAHGGTVSKRRYASYGAYLDHQKSKLETVRSRLEKNREEALENFVRRFESCEQLKPRSRVLCLGARLGTEVEAFIRLGHFAVGIDLNPGEENQFVVTGDFHRLVFADDSVDVVYANCLDHLFDLKAVGGEISRVLQPGGIAITDLVNGYEEGFIAGGFEAVHWARAEEFAGQLAEASGLQLEGQRSLAPFGKEHWCQAVLRKPPAPGSSTAFVPGDAAAAPGQRG